MSVSVRIMTDDGQSQSASHDTAVTVMLSAGGKNLLAEMTPSGEWAVSVTEGEIGRGHEVHRGMSDRFYAHFEAYQQGGEIAP